MTLKALKLKKKTKTKKNRSPDPAILGQVRTRDPDPDHFGPDFDSGSGYGSAFTDSKSGARLKARISRTDFTFFKRTFLDMNFYLRKVCLLLALKMGGTVDEKSV